MGIDLKQNRRGEGEHVQGALEWRMEGAEVGENKTAAVEAKLGGVRRWKGKSWG